MNTSEPTNRCPNCRALARSADPSVCEYCGYVYPRITETGQEGEGVLMSFEGLENHPRFAELMDFSPRLTRYKRRMAPVLFGAAILLACLSQVSRSLDRGHGWTEPRTFTPAAIAVLAIASIARSRKRRRANARAPLQRYLARVVSIERPAASDDPDDVLTNSPRLTLEREDGERESFTPALTTLDGLELGRAGIAYRQGSRLLDFKML